MTAKVYGLLLLAITVLANTSCATRVAKAEHDHPQITERWAIVGTGAPGEQFVLLKNTHDLEKAAKAVGCDKKQPCAIGHLGELYVISRPEPEKHQQH